MKIKIFFLFIFLSYLSFSQDTIDTTSFMKPPKNPQVAAILSAILPGAGQFYNEKYFKIPIIYVFLGASAYAFYQTNYYYKVYLNDLALLQKMNDGDTVQNYNLLVTGITNEELLTTKKNLYRRFRDISIFSFVAVWGLNVLDAYVDAHLSNFDVSDDLSLNISPYFYNNNFGLTLTLKFKPNAKNIYTDYIASY